MFQLTIVPVLSDMAVTFLSSLILLTPNDSFWIVQLFHSLSDVYRLFSFMTISRASAIVKGKSSP